MKTVSIIGSFRKPKHYLEITNLICKLKASGIEVLSPAGTEVVDIVDDFVMFESDDKSLTPEEIESATLAKILASDIVYVCDVDGYIGRTTAYEIGCCEVRNKEMYFLETPEDFEIFSPIKVLKPDELLEYITIKDKEQISKEITGIKEALVSGTQSYELKHNVEVEKKLMGMILKMKNQCKL